MRYSPLAFTILAILTACGASEPAGPVVSRDPISVRGWITDVEGGNEGTFRTVETEAARRLELFQATNVWVENAPYISGGVQDSGSFLLLDVPAGKVTIEFSAPGAPQAKLVLENVPGNADIYIPGMILTKTGVQFSDPAAVQVRLAARITQPHPTGKNALIAGKSVPIVEVPLAQLTDRHEFPVPPVGTAPPLATVR
jgi:hypothetical protein